MELSPFGRTGLRVSPIGLGTTKLGRNVGVKYPGGDGFALPSDDEVAELFRVAAEVGLNLIDTAPAYGTSEARIGAVMSRHGWFGGRDRWIICTKAGEEFHADQSGAAGRGGAHSRFDFTEAAIRASVDRSLSRLGVDHLDAVLLHSDGRDEWIIRESGGLNALFALREAGKVRAAGLSIKTARGGLMAIEHGCDVVMVTYNAEERAEEPVIAAAASAGCAVLVKKPLRSGHALDSARAIAFALAPVGVTSVVVGTVRPDHLRANVMVADDVR